MARTRDTTRHREAASRVPVRLGLLLLLLLAALARQAAAGIASTDEGEAAAGSADLVWSEGTELLLPQAERDRFAAADTKERRRLLEAFAATDPVPDTPEHELREGIRRRHELMSREFLTLLDDRARFLFLHGAPAERLPIDCDQVFRPMEIWVYAHLSRPLLFYRPEAEQPHRLWLPLDSKRVLYAEEMEYWLEQYHELRRYISGRRFDLQLCRHAKRIDEITGIDGLFAHRAERPTNAELLGYLAAPADLGQWARAAAATPLEGSREALAVEGVESAFPELRGQRMLARITLLLPTAENLETFQEGEGDPEYRLQVEGILEGDEAVFETFRMRFQVNASTHPEKLALVIDRQLRPGRELTARMRVRDEIGGGERVVVATVVVPTEPTPVPDVPVPESVIVALGDQLAERRIPGRDGIVLVPPEADVALGLWRADTLVSGDRIQTVRFVVDGELQFTRNRPPFTAELRLAIYPREQLVRVEGYDAAGTLVAADELLINQQRGELRVSITSPARGRPVVGRTEAVAEITVPEERRVVKVEFLVNEVMQAVRDAPPWRAEIEVPDVGGEQLAYLTVVAELDNGVRAEDVRFLNAPDFVDEIDVDLVELYTTVTDRSNRLVTGLTVEEFAVLEDGRPQEIARFELVDDLPLTIGITIDTSGSMIQSLGEARRAANEFLESMMTPKDRSFAVSFSDHVELVMARTSDVGAVAHALDSLLAVGSTALHDAVVTSLYYFRGVRGRRALILLSDGEDTSSTIPYRDALEYAKRSGVAVYSVGLDIGRLDFDVRKKLGELSEQTGGRSFFIRKAEELRTVYAEIERELRSQYLVAYNSDRPSGASAEFREVEVRVRGGKLSARTIRGYYP
jgi:VWFA-related protein